MLIMNSHRSPVESRLVVRAVWMNLTLVNRMAVTREAFKTHRRIVLCRRLAFNIP
jgi:hypothetical protein